MDKLRLELEYEWEPFTVTGQHLTFVQLRARPLFRNECSHWGAVVYKWQGMVMEGTHFPKIGILIGETDDLSQSIQQYADARPATKDAQARDDFLTAGDIRLYIFRPHDATLDIQDAQSVPDSQPVRGEWYPLLQATLVQNNARRRALYQQLLALGKAAQHRPYVWLVNREV